MQYTRSFPFLLLALVIGHVCAQQFADAPVALNYPTFSNSCLEALNTTVADCSSILLHIWDTKPRLELDELSVLCTPDCRTALMKVRETIAAGCTSSTDVFEVDAVVWPATYIIDQYLYTYDFSCRRDAGSGQFCDQISLAWLNSPPGTPAQDCSDCMLGVIQIQLNSPFGYHPEFAEDFQSMTASCSATGYSFTSPAPYAISTNYVPAPEPPTCAEPYIVQPGDTCDAIALSMSVSTYAVIKAGDLDFRCVRLQAGSSLCLPAQCSLYRVQYDETCDSILAKHNGLTLINLLNWNPNINPLCRNLDSLVETLICVSPPGGAPGEGTATPDPTPMPTEDPSTPVPKPTNGKDESNYPCAKWYTVADGDNCEELSIRSNIPLQDFYFLNPSINGQCSNLLLDIAYCVAAVGDISTYPSYPYSTSVPYTLSPPTYSTTTQTLSTVAPVITPKVELPIAPGTLDNCSYYVEHVPVPVIVDQRYQPDKPVITQNINSCDFATTAFGVSRAAFFSWNPSLDPADPCFLQEGYRYCALNHTSFLPTPGRSNMCLDIDSPHPGTITTCNCFTLVSGQEMGLRPCMDIAEDARITVSQLESWNPWVGTDCDAGVYAGLGFNDLRAVCIRDGGGSSSSSSSSSSNSATVTNGPTTTMTSPSAPTQPGIPSGCTKYHTAVAGDGCWDIANAYGITLDQFYQWNPAVSTDCSMGFWLGYAYCVAVG